MTTVVEQLRHKPFMIPPVFAVWLLVCLALVSPKDTFARDLFFEKDSGEQTVYVTVGEPTQISFPGPIAGGFIAKNARVSLQRQDDFIVVFAQPGLDPEGEVIIVHLLDKRSYHLRVIPSDVGHPRDDALKIIDKRPMDEILGANVPNPNTQIKDTESPYPPPSTVPGLMREMVLVAEFGKMEPPAGYQRSSTYSGEPILQDGTLHAELDEIFLGTDLWGYVVTVENLLETSQRINPASFRLDGTLGVVLEKTELAARPITAEQKIANAHKAKVYIVTRSKRR